jgi:O-antigen ligase
VKPHRFFFWLLILLLPVQLGKHFWPEFSLVFGLRVDYLSPTIYLTDLLALLTFGFWTIENLKNEADRSKSLKKIFGIFTTKELKILILPGAFFVFLLINSFLSHNRGASFFKFLKIVEFSLLGLYVAKEKGIKVVVCQGIPIAMVYSCLIAFGQFWSQASLGGIFWWLGERTFNAATPGIANAVFDGSLIMRPYATFSHPNSLAGFLLIGLVLTVPYWYQKSKAFTAFLLFLSLSTILLTFSRSVWLVGLLVGLWSIVSKERSKGKDRLTITIISLALALFFLLSAGFSTDEAITQRLQLIKSAALMWLANPLAGVGLNNFIVRLPEYWQNMAPVYLLQPVHNIFILAVSETGITGLLIFFWFLFLTIKRLLRADRLVLAALLSILILGFFDHYWLTLQQNQLLLTIVLGLAWSRIKV